MYPSVSADPFTVCVAEGGVTEYDGLSVTLTGPRLRVPVTVMVPPASMVTVLTGAVTA